MASLSRFWVNVSEEELNALIQKLISEKSKITRIFGKKMTLKYQFYSFTQRIVALDVWKNSIIVYQKSIVVLSFLFQIFLLKQL